MYFIDSTTFAVAWKLTLLLVAVFWLGLAFHVYRDARRRMADPLLVTTATLLGLVPFVGPVVYILFRPPETLDEMQLRDAEIRALELRVGDRGLQCPVCRAGVQPEFLVCPVCTTRLKQACVSCDAALETAWLTCPYCVTPVAARVVDLDLDEALTAEAASTAPSARARTPAA
jgi:hypothetical protein